MIICKDADLDEAAVACHVGLFINMGQCCCASSRILIHESVHDAFVEKVVNLAKTLRQGADAGGDKPTVRILMKFWQGERLELFSALFANPTS